MIVVLTTVSSQAAGEDLAAKIVEAKLAACVQIMPQMTSVYLWKGLVTKDDEHLMLIKTLPAAFDELSALITANHTYEVPEIVAIDAGKVSRPYLNWMEEVLGDQM